MAERTLIKAGPFLGIQASADPYYLEQPYAAFCSNVDVSYRYGGFSSAQGRTVLGSIILPADYKLQCVVPFLTFTGDNPVKVKRVYVFSAYLPTQNNRRTEQSVFYQGWYDPDTNTTAQLSYCNPFTKAVQFGSSLWTNGGNKIIFKTDSTLLSDDWQVQVPANLSYNIFGTSVTQAGSAENTTYTYAITIRRALNWTITGSATPYTFYPDPDTLQESSPIFSTSVTTTAGQQPALSYPSSLLLPVQGLTGGGEQYYGALYRATTTNPTFQFVDYLINLPTGTGADGNPCFIDTYSAASITNNANLIIHHDPPPIVGQVYPGAVYNNSAPSSLLQQQQQQAFTYTNPAFLAKHKNRMWTFTLYPSNAIGSSPTTNPQRISLSPQLWCSDLGQPWSFNDDPAQNQVQIVGPEDTPGNNAIDNFIGQLPPWEPGQVEDAPMGLASTGSYLVMFKSQSTWILLGDSPSEFIPRRAFNIGCVASNSITEAEGGVFWLAPQGVYFFDGGSPEYVGEDVRGIIEGLAWSDIQNAQGSYSDRTFYLSFSNITLCYYAPAKKWYPLPYGADLAVFSPYNQNQLLFVSGTQLQTMNASNSQDLGNPIVSTWIGQLSDSEAPGQLKQYRYIVLRAPSGQQGTCAITLTLDAGSGNAQTCTFTFDLSHGNNAHVADIGLQGYVAQLSITTTTTPSTTQPIQINSVAVVGDVTAALKPTQTTDLLSIVKNGQRTFPHV